MGRGGEKMKQKGGQKEGSEAGWKQTMLINWKVGTDRQTERKKDIKRKTASLRLNCFDIHGWLKDYLDLVSL